MNRIEYDKKGTKYRTPWKTFKMEKGEEGPMMEIEKELEVEWKQEELVLKIMV